jgi:hypothetical protein
MDQGSSREARKVISGGSTRSASMGRRLPYSAIARTAPQRAALSMMAAFGRHRESGVAPSLTGDGRGGEAVLFEAIEFVSR